MNYLSAVWTLAANDLKMYFRDRLAMMLGFLLPIALVTVFGFIMGKAGGSGGAMPKVRLWVSDRDGSDASRQLVQTLRESEMIRVSPSAEEFQRLDEAECDRIEQKVADGDASHVLVIEKGFSKATSGGDDTGLRLIRDPGRELEQRLIEMSIMQSMFTVRDSDYWSVLMRDRFSDAGMERDRLSEFSDAADRLNSVIQNWVDESPDNPLETSGVSSFDMIQSNGQMKTTDVVPPSRPKQVTYQLAQSVAGVSVMMLMFGMASAGTTLVNQRSDGTLARLLAAPLPRSSILVGKVVYLAVIGIIQMLVMLIYGELLFGIGVFRDPVTLLALTLAWTFAATSLGILIASFSKTSKQAESITPIIALTLAALGGCWFPLQMLDLPTPVAMLTKSTVTYWAMSGFQGYFWDGLSLSTSKVSFAILVQIGFAIVVMAIASRLFQRNYLRG